MRSSCLLTVAFVLSTLSGQVSAVRKIQIASPLQCLTIWDPEVKENAMTRRERFLSKFRAGLKAETEARKEISDSDKQLQQAAAAADPNNPDWANQAALLDRSRYLANERKIESAHDKAVSKVEEELKEKIASIKGSSNKYQFVGVVNPSKSEGKPPISWYARKKPKHARWTVRLVHVNRDAIIKDLFNRGKIDILARYDNTGKKNEETNQPIVTSKYIVRQKSFKNLWNFSPKHFFTDSSGMYWRERRLRSGLYTDGSTVYESSYRYRDGRNGMHRVSSFQQYLNSRAVDQKKKEKILKRLKEDTPDVVLEE